MLSLAEIAISACGDVISGRDSYFPTHLLKLGEKASQVTLLCLAFDGFILSAADLVDNSTAS